MKQWVRIRSWHLSARIVGGGIKTRCGRLAPFFSEQAELRPEGKTCESCLRRAVGR